MYIAYMDNLTVNVSGNAIQHLHYLPFGEDWVDQRISSWNTPYTFSGKEKDTETGYGYFGARYYNSDLSIWLSVDPMSDKYPSLSPYNYCANNPVILVDPDGRLIWVKGEDGTLYKYHDGYLWKSETEQYIPVKGSFEDKIWSDLKVLNKSKSFIISNRLRNLEKSFHNITIEQTIDINGVEPENKDDAKTKFVGTNSTVKVNFNEDNYDTSTLAHELLGHAHDNDWGFRTEARTKGDWGINFIEISAVNVQNIIRDELGLPQRTNIDGINKKGEVENMQIPKEYLNNYFIDGN